MLIGPRDYKSEGYEPPAPRRINTGAQLLLEGSGLCDLMVVQYEQLAASGGYPSTRIRISAARVSDGAEIVEDFMPDVLGLGVPEREIAAHFQKQLAAAIERLQQKAAPCPK